MADDQQLVSPFPYPPADWRQHVGGPPPPLPAGAYTSFGESLNVEEVGGGGVGAGADASASVNGAIGAGGARSSPTQSAAAAAALEEEAAGKQLDTAPRARLKQLNRSVVKAFEDVLAAQLATHEQGLTTGGGSGGEAAVRELTQKVEALDEQLRRMNAAINALRPRQAHEILATLMRNQRGEREASVRALDEAHQAAVAPQGQ